MRQLTPRSMSIIRAALAALILVPLVACGDLTAPRASLSTFDNSLIVFPLNGSPPNAPNVINLATAVSQPADPGLNFDLAFDVDTTTGTITILPVALVANQLAGARQIGLQKVSTPYDSLTHAPHSGYVTDSALVVRPGVTAVAAVTDPVYCYGSFFSTTYYSKVVVDSVDAQHALHVRVTVDPNCGFYTLSLGVPKD